MKTTVIVNGNVLLGMAMLAAKDGTRPAIQGVRLRVFKEEKDGKNAIWIATDGRRLGLYHDKVTIDGGFPVEITEAFTEFTIVPPCVIKPTKKQPNLTFEHEVIPMSGEVANKTYKPETISCLYHGGNLTEKCTLPVGNGYTAWKQVVPKTPPEKSSQIVVSPALLHGFTLAAAKISGLNPRNMTVIIRPLDVQGLSPYTIQFPMPSDFYGILMPMRTDREYIMPEFVKAQL